jgi:hypothetical protein
MMFEWNGETNIGLKLLFCLALFLFSSVEIYPVTNLPKSTNFVIFLVIEIELLGWIRGRSSISKAQTAK